MIAGEYHLLPTPFILSPFPHVIRLNVSFSFSYSLSFSFALICFLLFSRVMSKSLSLALSFFFFYPYFLSSFLAFFHSHLRRTSCIAFLRYQRLELKTNTRDFFFRQNCFVFGGLLLILLLCFCLVILGFLFFCFARVIKNSLSITHYVNLIAPHFLSSYNVGVYNNVVHPKLLYRSRDSILIQLSQNSRCFNYRPIYVIPHALIRYSTGTQSLTPFTVENGYKNFSRHLHQPSYNPWGPTSQQEIT